MKTRPHCFLCIFGVVAAAAAAASGEPSPIVIAHRGASGYLPEHTLPAYALAYGLGADYIEPDLVLTQDQAVIALHDLHLEATTDVATRFPARKRDDGHWYAADFTLEEIRQLRVQERTDKRFPQGKSAFRIPTFQEVIELVQGLNSTMDRQVGIYPEIKDPVWHRENGLPLAERILDILGEYGYTNPEDRCFIQCFYPEELQRIRPLTRLPLIQLISNRQQELWTAEGLAAIARYAQGVGPDKRLVSSNPELVGTAQQHGLQVHPYTFRKDQPGADFPDFAAELRTFIHEYRVDGLFTDHPDAAVAAR